MSQSFNFASNYTHTNFNGSDCSAVYLNGTRIWERYTAQRQVWVSSGYNQTSLVYQGQHFDGDNFAYFIQADQKEHRITVKKNVYGNPTGYWRLRIYGWSTTPKTITSGAYRFSRGSLKEYARDGSRYYYLRVHKSVTSWVDTSSYQTENYTAYYY